MWKRPWFCEIVTFGRKVKKQRPKTNGRNPKSMEADGRWFSFELQGEIRFQPLVFGGVYFEFRILKWPTASRKPLKKGKRAPNFGHFHPSPKTIHLKYNQGLFGGLWHFFWHISTKLPFIKGGFLRIVDHHNWTVTPVLHVSCAVHSGMKYYHLKPNWPLFLGGLTFHSMRQIFQNMRPPFEVLGSYIPGIFLPIRIFGCFNGFGCSWTCIRQACFWVLKMTHGSCRVLGVFCWRFLRTKKTI